MHWRTLHRGTEKQRKVPVKAHERGDSRLGIIIKHREVAEARRGT
jgi:hypothetical protein